MDELTHKVVIRMAVCNLVLLVGTRSPWGWSSSPGLLPVSGECEVPKAALFPSSVFDLGSIWSFSELVVVLDCIESAITISTAWTTGVMVSFRAGDTVQNEYKGVRRLTFNRREGNVSNE